MIIELLIALLTTGNNGMGVGFGGGGDMGTDHLMKLWFIALGKHWLYRIILSIPFAEQITESIYY